jgi:hypothetical protein
MISIVLFTKQMRETKKQQIHAQGQISKVQRKIFVTVSMALLFYTLFYVIPTLMQMMNKVKNIQFETHATHMYY